MMKFIIKRLSLLVLALAVVIGGVGLATAGNKGSAKGVSKNTAKKSSKASRTIKSLKKALGFKKSPTAARASYTSVRSRSSSSSTGQSKSTVQTSSGPATNVKVNVSTTRNVMATQVKSGLAPSRPVAVSQVPGLHAAIRAANQPRQQAQQRVMRNAAVQHPSAARPQPQGPVQGQAPRPLPSPQRSAGNGAAPPKPPALVRNNPGFGFRNGQKVSYPTGQGQTHLPAKQPAASSIYDRVKQVPPKTRNQYDSVNQPL